MPDSIIVCPKCKEMIPLTSAIEGPIAERLRQQFELANKGREEAVNAREKVLGAQVAALEKAKLAQERELAEKLAAERKKLVAEAKQNAEAQLAVQLGDLQNQIAEKQKLLAVAQASQVELLKQQRELAEQKEALARSFEEQLAKKMQAEREKIAGEATARARQSQAAELADLQLRLTEKEAKLQNAQKIELDLLKQKRELEEKKQAFELEAARTLDQEREKIKAAVLRMADEAHRLQLAEKDKQLSDAKQQADDLKRKLEQGSQQMQGEVLELELERLLRQTFPHDQILPVAKGVHGGDVVHRVMTPTLQHCGSILWESKRTKSWGADWIDKVKDDQRAAKADIAVIVSVTLPKDVSHMALVEGVWVTSRECMMGMVAALRSGLVRLADANRAAEGKHEKMEVLYHYLSGHEFKQRVEAIVEAFTALQEDLEQERRAMQKIWAKRAKQLERVMDSTTGMYGDLAAIIGAALPTIEAIELPVLPAAEDGEE
jgi:hypothetical protein